MKSKQDPNLFSEGLKLVSYCPLCETRFNSMEARVLGEDQETHLLHITCKKCRNSILALVLLSGSGSSSVGVITDLSADDVFRFKRSKKISTDDVIEVHTLFKGDKWQKVLQPKRKISRSRKMTKNQTKP
ncbi:hypothetical protein ACFLZY_00210 [Patescibacteria group bacterium]